MTRRIKTAEQSARRERDAANTALLTMAADSNKPADPRRQGEHYRSHLVDAHRVIGVLQAKIAGLEAALEKTRRDFEYASSLSVTRTVAEDARQRAAAAMRYAAASLAEGADGEPNALSDAIENLPLPKPKFLN